ncbi:uncharacterized protein J4E88_004134 [Alternaria novae-zelandiae]|uniref:uncharacterized protein n=1 Tax=Alternaria novae-zelandiae TaxID=430562 RepID=UPI0020C569C8|nr:uncharacterized protein J4E88_004134 [Alternaria novae-zelandiae]KAI4684693.1 hypothetical protein J4E88_004134 [Alternaria novae-zelandiae]
MPEKQQSLPLRQQPDPYDNEPPSPPSEDDMAPNQQRGLYDAIFIKLVRSEFSKQDFLPEDDFETLITEDTVKEELDNTLEAFDPSLVKYIAKHARKTFATLVIQGKVHKAVNLEKSKFNDDYLPIANEESGLTSLNGLSRDRHAWRWFKSWWTQERNEFCEKQWTFLSPIFESNSMMEVLHRDCRLPFITCDSKIDEGSFSFVHKGTIHHAHHKISSGNLVIAIKELRDTAVGADQRELAALDLARKLQHPHIVPFVGGFRQGTTSHLLFQWADGGNLRSYWNNKENWSRDADLISWTIEQIKGLFSALRKWHDLDELYSTPLNGRHGDLKPENLLRSLGAPGSRRSIFQIADLGLAKIHSNPTHARNKPSSTLGGTPRYKPPEDKPKISRSYDMWSMGCITLEWIIWLVYGIDELGAFYEQACPEDCDSFWSRESDDHPTHPGVISWMKHMTDTCLADEEHCYSIALRKLLIFVRNRLLVPDPVDYDTTDTTQQSKENSDLSILITPAPDAGSIKSLSGRAKCKDACTELENISSIPNGVRNYMYNPGVNMNGPNGRGPSKRISSKLQVPSTSSSHQEVNGPLDNR